MTVPQNPYTIPTTADLYKTAADAAFKAAGFTEEERRAIEGSVTEGISAVRSGDGLKIIGAGLGILTALVPAAAPAAAVIATFAAIMSMIPKKQRNAWIDDVLARIFISGNPWEELKWDIHDPIHASRLPQFAALFRLPRGRKKIRQLVLFGTEEQLWAAAIADIARVHGPESAEAYVRLGQGVSLALGKEVITAHWLAGARLRKITSHQVKHFLANSYHPNAPRRSIRAAVRRLIGVKKELTDEQARVAGPRVEAAYNVLLALASSATGGYGGIHAGQR